MKFIADFHVHSRFSRATSKLLDLEHYYITAQQKGISVVGTGDFTHPAWFAELREKLVPAEAGLWKLRGDIAKVCDAEVSLKCRGEVRFLLTCEISNIYKKDQKTRKNHNLVFFPDFETASRFNKKMEAIGNIHSDGRPILGLDARHLLEIILEIDKNAFLVPAHIWTPWFSVLGSQSGFDSIEECFEDLTSYIFAAETGLSSDPAMNWRISGLDRLMLISNSDAHSHIKLGREANIFDTELSFPGIRHALSTGDANAFLGTYEFYPEEGKYHLDGHRKCAVRFQPEETRKHQGICPVCKKPLTRGVLYRVEELADRPPGFEKQNRLPYYNVLPLMEIIADILQVGAQSKKVVECYHQVLNTLGNEFAVLGDLSIETISAAGIPLLGEAIRRMRGNNIRIQPGYDGEFGRLEIFSPEERDRLSRQQGLFGSFSSTRCSNKQDELKECSSVFPEKKEIETPARENEIAGAADLNSEQQRAIRHEASPLLIVAGPGTGKTLTLTHRIAHVIDNKNVSSAQVLAVTFTNKAAREMADRLKKILKPGTPLPFTATFHSFCFSILKEIHVHKNVSIVNEFDRHYIVTEAMNWVRNEKGAMTLDRVKCLEGIIAAKQNILAPDDLTDDFMKTLSAATESEKEDFKAAYGAYQQLLAIQDLFDFEDLIFNVVRLFEQDEKICMKYRKRYPYIFVDEYQDLNHGQYRLIKALAPESSAICVIGDPDQSIYGFRGSDVMYFNRFIADYPTATVIHLKKNYRSTETILEASYQVIRDQHVPISGARTYSEIHDNRKITLLETQNEKTEAVAVGKMIERMVGGFGFHSIDFNKADSADSEQISFADIAVLFRTHAQINIFEDVFGAAGIPFQVVSKENLMRNGIRELLSLRRIISGNASYADLERTIALAGHGLGKKAISIFKDWCYRNHFSVMTAILNCERFPIPGLRTETQYKLNEFFNEFKEIGKNIEPLSMADQLRFLIHRFSSLSAVIKEDEKNAAAWDQVIAAAGKYPHPQDFFEQIALQSDTDCHDEKSERVALLTIHAAKGLEFPVVFIAGCEDGYLPHRPCDSAEEKRLFYVAMTRAKSWLILSSVRKRRIFGETVERAPSPFITEIEKDLLQKNLGDGGRKKAENQKQHVQLSLFSDMN